MDNFRFYLIDTTQINDDFDYINCSDSEFIEKAEVQGLVYSPFQFVNDFNNEAISTNTMQLRIINVNSK